jgi:phosphatidylinositol glycan class B
LTHQALKYYPVVVAAAIIIYLATAFNSLGFYHADEHYQIIEFAGSKLGTHTPEELPWEYKAQMRSAFQPTICYLILKSLIFFKITDPYQQAFFLRFITAMLALLVINYFIKKTENQFENIGVKKAYYLLSYFLWFIPFLSVRFSSETWSGLFFLLALAIYFNSKQNLVKPFLIGLFLGVAFLFRFQILISILGFLLWLLFINRVQIAYLLKLMVAFLLVLTLGLVIDSWFYGKLVFTPWIYFYKTILEGTGPDFGSFPWYYYISNLITLSGFIGIFFLFAFIILALYKPKNIILWCVFPFLLVHSIIPHKEERFLFPMVYLFPIIIIMAYDKLISAIKNKFIINLIKYSFIFSFVTVNLLGLVAMGSKPAGIGRMSITKYIHNDIQGKRINLIYCAWANPYNPWRDIPMKFYVEEKMTEKRINNLCELNDSLLVPGAENFLVIRKYDLENTSCQTSITNNNFILKTQSIPEWIVVLNNQYKGFDNLDVLMLYKYEKRN